MTYDIRNNLIPLKFEVNSLIRINVILMFILKKFGVRRVLYTCSDSDQGNFLLRLASLAAGTARNFNQLHVDVVNRYTEDIGRPLSRFGY